MSEFADLRARAFAANMEIPAHNLAIYTFGNVSVADRVRSVFAIKPSGVPYEHLTAADMVLVGLDGAVVDGSLRPSSDTKTHAVLYREFPSIGSVVHTHSPYAVGWAQALAPIPILGTTHADHAAVDIPCTPPMDDECITGDYEAETGLQIVNHFRRNHLDPEEIEMVLVGSHGPFTWARTPEKAVYNAVVLEELAKMALVTRLVNPDASRLKESLRQKHYERKHGAGAYYGQE